MPGKAFGQQRQGQHAQRQRYARRGRQDLGTKRPEQTRHPQAQRHQPIQQWGLLQVTDAVGIQRDRVTPQQHLARHLHMHGVRIIQQRRTQQRKARIEAKPEPQRDEKRGARPLRDGRGHRA